MFRINPVLLLVALIAFCSFTSTATSSSATIFHDRNAVHQQEAFTYGIISTVAGSITGGGSTLTDIQATTAKLDGPAGITMDTSGNLYISDKEGHRIMKVTTSTGIITAVAGTGVAGYSGDGGEAVKAKVDSPEGLQFDKSGNLYFADPALHRIRKITMSTGIITTVAGNGDNLYDKDNVAATSTTLSSPSDIALDSDGNIYIADTYNHRIRKVTVSTGIITTVAGNGTAIEKSIRGSVVATANSVYRPIGIAVDKSANIFIVSDSSYRIYKVTASTGIMTYVAGSIYSTYDLANSGPLDNYIRPNSLALDNSGNLYMTTMNVVKKWNVTTNIISVVAGSGTYTSNGEGDGKRSTMAYLYTPRGIYADSTGNFYFCDTGHNTVRKVTYADATPTSSTTPSPAAAPSSTTPGTPTSVVSTSTSSPAATPTSSSSAAPTPTTPSSSSKAPAATPSSSSSGAPTASTSPSVSKAPATSTGAGAPSSTASNVAGSFYLTIFLMSSLLVMQLRRDA